MVWQPHYGMELSQSEREIMEMFCDGMTSGEIARERRTTENTVRAQLAVSRKKLGAKNVTHAAVIFVIQEKKA